MASQLLGHRPADPAVGADHGALVEPTDASIQASPPEGPGRLPGHHQLGHRAQGHEQGQDPGQDERDDEGLTLGIQRLDLAEADRGQVMTVMYSASSGLQPSITR